MLGDKLTAFAPNTIGILYKTTNQLFSKNTEIIKQLYDISKLIEKSYDINLVKSTYIKIAAIQILNRSLSIEYNDCLEDTINTCKLILSDGSIGGTKEEYLNIKKGFEGFSNYVVNKIVFNDLYAMATKVYILSIKLLFLEHFDVESKVMDTFINKTYKKVKFTIGIPLYRDLMRACFVENYYKIKIK